MVMLCLNIDQMKPNISGYTGNNIRILNVGHSYLKKIIENGAFIIDAYGLVISGV